MTPRQKTVKEMWDDLLLLDPHARVIRTNTDPPTYYVSMKDVEIHPRDGADRPLPAASSTTEAVRLTWLVLTHANTLIVLHPNSPNRAEVQWKPWWDCWSPRWWLS